jgi:uncharacterized membrane protein
MGFFVLSGRLVPVTILSALDKQAIMSTQETRSARKADKTLVGIVIAIILVAVVNAGISVVLALSIQHNYNAARTQQQQQSQIVFSKLCTTLQALHADKPPSGTTPSMIYIQGLHDRLGELATDLKC